MALFVNKKNHGVDFQNGKEPEVKEDFLAPAFSFRERKRTLAEAMRLIGRRWIDEAKRQGRFLPVTRVIRPDLEKREPGKSIILLDEQNHHKRLQDPETILIELAWARDRARDGAVQSGPKACRSCIRDTSLAFLPGLKGGTRFLFFRGSSTEIS